MRAIWIVIATVCFTVVECAAVHKSGEDTCCNGNKILDTIQKVVAYGGHKRHNSHHNHHFTAFTAYLGTSFTGSQNRQRVVFDRVVTNYGNAYNHRDGVFTSPTDGVYMFENNLLSQKSKHGHTKIVVNGKNVPIASNGQSASGLHSTGTVSGVLQLKKGDRVWIITYKGYTLHSEYSTFSGWLLHEI